MKPARPDPAGTPATSVRVLNLPNVLTVIRVLCVPLMAGLLWIDGGANGATRDLAAAVFVFASVTDVADGLIARRYGLITTFGKVADPIADKALIGVALVSLSLLGDLAWWVTAVILVRELGVTALRFWVIEHGVIPASRGGKAKTLAQTIAITMYLVDAPWPWWADASAAMMGAAVILTVATGVDYVVRALRLRAAAKAAESA